MSPESTCPRCAQPMDPARAGYSESGMLVCRTCVAAEQVAAPIPGANQRVTVLYGSFGSLLVAVMSFCVESRLVFFLFPLVAIAGGLGTLFQAGFDEYTRSRIGWKRYPSMVASVLAVLLGVTSIVVSLSLR